MVLAPLKLFTRNVNDALEVQPSVLVTCTNISAPSVKVVLDKEESKVLVTLVVSNEPLTKN